MKKTIVDREVAISISLFSTFFLLSSVKLDSRIPFPKLMPWKNTLALIYIPCSFVFWLQTFAKPMSAFKPSHGSSRTITPYAHIHIFFRTVSDMPVLHRRLKYSLILVSVLTHCVEIAPAHHQSLWQLWNLGCINFKNCLMLPTPNNLH